MPPVGFGVLMPRVFEPNTVTILPTNNCTAKCRHCSMNSGPDRNDTLSWEQLDMMMTQLFDQLDIGVIVFSGGESTLLGDDLLKAIDKCRQHGVLSRLVTNAFWADSPEAALAKLTELREAGLDELNISTDDYHLPFISLQKVRYAYEAAIQLDFHAVAICNAYGPDGWLTPDLLNGEFGGNEDMKRRFGADGHSLYHERKEEETLLLLSNGQTQKLGRGIGKLTEEEVDQHDKEFLYDMADKVGGCPWAIRSAAISSKGHFVSCCGFEVEDNEILDYGDLNEKPLSELLERADNDLITNMIAIMGPPKIKQFLEQMCPDEVDFPRESYRSYCEVCEDLVGIRKNREAMYKYQGAFVESVSNVRAIYEENFTTEAGTVRVPPGANLSIVFSLDGEGDEGGTIDGIPAKLPEGMKLPMTSIAAVPDAPAPKNCGDRR